jgi:glycosyltransferase involved in cell wall biosynthesis
MDNVPEISIILPTYNRASLLKRAMQSISEQSFSNWEVIVINGASTDDTKNFLDERAKKDSRVRPVHHERNYYPDISRILNEGLKLSRGKYIARLDDDDYWCDPEKLSKQIAFLDARPDCVIAGGGTIVVDENDRERFRYMKLETDESIRARALFSNPFTHSTVMFHRDVALEVGGYGDFKNAEDWDLWLRMGMRGKFYNFQEYFVRYLMTDQSKTFLFKRSQSKEILSIVRAHRKEYPNFYMAYTVNLAQYFYSFLPKGIRRISHGFFSKLKRGISSN